MEAQDPSVTGCFSREGNTRPSGRARTPIKDPTCVIVRPASKQGICVILDSARACFREDLVFFPLETWWPPASWPAAARRRIEGILPDFDPGIFFFFFRALARKKTDLPPKKARYAGGWEAG